MAVYEYRALTVGGKESSGIIDADSPQAARRRLRERNLFPVEMNVAAEAPITRREVRFSTMFGPSMQMEISLFTRQLAVLLGAGMPLVETLTAILEQLDNPRLKRVLFSVRDTLTEGSSLADALGAHPRVFSQLYVNMVRAGESSGSLEVILLRLAEYIETQFKLRRRIQSIMLYPAFVLIVGTGIMVYLMTFVMPKIAQVLGDIGGELPTSTALLIKATNIINNYWWVGLAAVIFGYTGLHLYRRTPAGRRNWDRFRLWAPLFGKLSRKYVIARFTRTLGTLHASGLPIMISLDIVKQIVGNTVIEEAIEEAKTAIRQGNDLASPLKQSGVFPSMVTHMIALGERSGQLEQMMLKIAEEYDDEVETTINALVSLLQPTMVVIMAIGVGLLLFGVLGPIFNLSSIQQ